MTDVVPSNASDNVHCRLIAQSSVRGAIYIQLDFNRIL
jgi:hypothetical protein